MSSMWDLLKWLLVAATFAFVIWTNYKKVDIIDRIASIIRKKRMLHYVDIKMLLALNNHQRVKQLLKLGFRQNGTSANKYYFRNISGNVEYPPSVQEKEEERVPDEEFVDLEFLSDGIIKYKHRDYVLYFFVRSSVAISLLDEFTTAGFVIINDKREIWKHISKEVAPHDEKPNVYIYKHGMQPECSIYKNGYEYLILTYLPHIDSTGFCYFISK